MKLKKFSWLLILAIGFGAVVWAAVTDFTSDANVTVSAVTFGGSTADMLVLSGSTAESWSYDSGTFTATNPGTFKVGSSDTAVIALRVLRSDALVQCAYNGDPGTSYVELPTAAAIYTISPS